MLYGDSSNLSLVWCDLIVTIMIGNGIIIDDQAHLASKTYDVNNAYDRINR